MKRLTIIGLCITAIYIVLIFTLTFWQWDHASKLELNAWGDFISGLLAPLALLWVVVGYFQQGEELRLNTLALRAQQEELHRQVEETQVLVLNAERQAAASEQLATISKKEFEKVVTREHAEAQPNLIATGGALAGPGLTAGACSRTDVKNIGGQVTNVDLVYAGPFAISFSGGKGRVWDHDATWQLLIEKHPSLELSFPIDFGIQYTDKFGKRGEKQYRMTSSSTFSELVS